MILAKEINNVIYAVKTSTKQALIAGFTDLNLSEITIEDEVTMNDGNTYPVTGVMDPRCVLIGTENVRTINASDKIRDEILSIMNNADEIIEYLM